MDDRVLRWGNYRFPSAIEPLRTEPTDVIEIADMKAFLDELTRRDGEEEAPR